MNKIREALLKEAKKAFSVFMDGKVSLDVMELSRTIADEYTVFQLAFPQATGYLSGYIDGIAELDRIESEKPGEDVEECYNKLIDEKISLMDKPTYVNIVELEIELKRKRIKIIEQFAERYHQSRMEHMKKTGECEQYDLCLEKFIEHWNKKSRMEEKKVITGCDGCMYNKRGVDCPPCDDNYSGFKGDRIE